MASSERKGLCGRLLGAFGREPVAQPRPPAAAPLSPPPATLERFLASELRLPLATLARLGARLASRTDAELAAVGRALAHESERLDVLVTNALELGLVSAAPAPRGQLVVAEAVEKAVTGQRAWIEALAIRVRVVDASEEAAIDGEREPFVAALFALLGDLLERIPSGTRLELRVRETHGLVRVDAIASSLAAASGAPRPAWTRAAELIDRLGGELYAGSADEPGFGLALPRHGAGELRRAGRSGRLVA